MNSPSWHDSHLKVGGATSRLQKNTRVTIKDIADLAGVSTATVSNVVNETGKVGRATRERVKRAIRSTRWKPNIDARNLARTNRSRRSTKNISLGLSHVAEGVGSKNSVHVGDLDGLANALRILGSLRPTNSSGLAGKLGSGNMVALQNHRNHNRQFTFAAGTPLPKTYRERIEFQFHKRRRDAK